MTFFRGFYSSPTSPKGKRFPSSNTALRYVYYTECDQVVKYDSEGTFVVVTVVITVFVVIVVMLLLWCCVIVFCCVVFIIIAVVMVGN